MKYLMIAMVLIFGGCSQFDNTYETGKQVYTIGKAVAPLVPMDEETRAALIAVDEVASKYDTARTIIRETEEKKKDVNTTSLQEK